MCKFNNSTGYASAAPQSTHNRALSLYDLARLSTLVLLATVVHILGLQDSSNTLSPTKQIVESHTNTWKDKWSNWQVYYHTYHNADEDRNASNCSNTTHTVYWQWLSVLRVWELWIYYLAHNITAKTFHSSDALVVRCRQGHIWPLHSGDVDLHCR